MVVMEVSLENCSSISYGKQGLFYCGLFLDIALLMEFYFVHCIGSVSLSFFPAHICCCGSSEKICCWLSCEAMVGQYLAFKKWN